MRSKKKKNRVSHSALVGSSVDNTNLNSAVVEKTYLLMVVKYRQQLIFLFALYSVRRLTHTDINYGVFKKGKIKKFAYLVCI